MSKKEWVIYASQGLSIAALLDFVFYRSVVVFFCLIPLGFCYPLMIRNTLKKKREEQLKIQFKDAILSLSSCLNAGYSVENGFSEVLRDMDRVYGKESMISSEIRLILYKIRLNRTVGDALGEFAARSGIDEIRSFSNVFLTARENGGELMKIIAGTAEIISEKLRIHEDILNATAARRLEQNIMNAVPIAVVLYLEAASPGFFQILYETMIGRIIMSICLVIYLGSYCAAKKILEIEV